MPAGRKVDIYTDRQTDRHTYALTRVPLNLGLCLDHTTLCPYLNLSSSLPSLLRFFLLTSSFQSSITPTFLIFHYFVYPHLSSLVLPLNLFFPSFFPLSHFTHYRDLLFLFLSSVLPILFQRTKERSRRFKDSEEV